MKKWRNSEK